MPTPILPALLPDYQADMATSTVSVACSEPQCDAYQARHVMPVGMEPAVHEILLTHVGLSRAEGEREWRMWLANPLDEYSEEQALQLLRDVTAASALMRDLHANTSH